jgi:hypothetical protein
MSDSNHQDYLEMLKESVDEYKLKILKQLLKEIAPQIEEVKPILALYITEQLRVLDEEQ